MEASNKNYLFSHENENSGLKRNQSQKVQLQIELNEAINESESILT